MEILIGCLIVVLIIRWVIVRDRMARMESRIAELTARLNAQSEFIGEIHRRTRPAAEPRPAASERAPAPAESTPAPAPSFKASVPIEHTPVESPQVEVPQRAPRVSSPEWETILGGNWLNKLGVFVLVIGLALLLSYSFTKLGPAGRVGISIAASLALLTAGSVLESKERYRIFARGLLGGGWAGLYVTVYAMHAVPAARVIDNPAMGALLLLAVAAGMIAHSLRYRSQTVTGVAYFVAFGTLAITDMATLPAPALIPLAASLLYVAHRFGWVRMTLLGAIGTYGVVLLRGDTGAALWEAQAVFVVYWLLFEAFDVLHPEAWLLPLNAAGFLGLSILKWQSAAPQQLWIFLAAAACVYLAGALLRVRSGKWHGAATLTALLAAAAIFQKLDQQWIASALVIEAELFFLAGLRLRTPYLRWLGTGLFGIEVIRVLAIDCLLLPSAQWTPVACLDVVIFYLNRALWPAGSFFGFAGAGMLALVLGKAVHDPYRSVGLQIAAAATFAYGWWKRLADFRVQGYLLLPLALAATAAEARELPLALAAALGYAAVFCALLPDRLRQDERQLLRLGGGLIGIACLLALLWRLASPDLLAPSWAAAALALLWMAREWKIDVFRWQSFAAAAFAYILGMSKLWDTAGPLWTSCATIACFYAAQMLSKRESRERLAFSCMATTLAAVLLYYRISGSMLTMAWGIEGAILLASGFPLRDRVLRISGLALLLACILKLFMWDLRHLETLPRIFSFIVLGLILLAVSWVYTRFRERVAKLL